MQKPRLILFGVIAAGLALYAGWWTYWLTRPALPVKTPAAIFFERSLIDSEGQHQPLAQWRGKYILVNFWATWCPPCLEEIPLLVDVQQRYAAQDIGVLGIAVLSAANQLTEVNAMRDRLKINYPVLLGSLELFEWMKPLGNEQGALPFSVLFSPQGEVVQIKKGPYKKSELAELLASLKLPSH